MKITRHDVFFCIALITGIYAVLISPVWTYCANLIIGIPALIVSFIFWKAGKRNDVKQVRYKYVTYCWAAAVTMCLISLVGFLLFN